MKPDTLILATLTLLTSALAAWMVHTGNASPLEAISFVTGAACVWLTVKESLWNFPISLLNVATFSVVFFRAKLYSDASLQVVYFILTAIGWYLWRFGGERHTTLHITRTRNLEIAAVLAGIAALAIILWQTFYFLLLWQLHDYRAGSVTFNHSLSTSLSPRGIVTFFDALTTAISLGAQWLLNRKKLENWLLWILADIIYIPLYLFKELYLTSLLYAVFLIMATIGYLQWRATWKKCHKPVQGFEVVLTPSTTEAAS